MIRTTEVYPIGKLTKPHGISGEAGFHFTSDVFDRTESPYWVFEMDGILVPFFLESWRFRSAETALVKFEGIDSDAQVKELCGKEVFYPVRFADNEEQSADNWNFYVGFNVYEEQAGYIGEITAVDDSTMNVLFNIRKEEDEFLIPVAEEFFTHIDMETREMKVKLPEGLLSL